MTSPDDPPEAGSPGSRLRKLSAGLAGAAVLIGVVTLAARAVGFGRYLVFSHTVGQTCLGTVYITANHVPTVLFDAFLGGALVSIVVPVLAGPIARGVTGETGRIASALLTWALMVLIPLAVAVALLAGPVVGWLLGGSGGCSNRAAVVAATRMLLLFLPQLPLYGVTVVLSGVLQAHRRFLGPALAPLFSSLVVVSSYLLFSVVATPGRSGQGVAAVGLLPQLVLAAGTTLGAGALALTVLVPTWRAGVRLRPTLRFPPGVAARARALAAAGVVTLLAHQVVITAVIRLANSQGSPGSVQLYNYAWQLFHLPYAVLAIPIATSAFPALATHADRGDSHRYAGTAAATTRAVLLVCCAAAAVLAGAAEPIARVFLLGAPGDVDPAVLARALAAFAPGLVGYGLVAHLGRALYASGNNRASATAVATGWMVVLLADIALAFTVPPRWVVTVFGLGTTIGLTVAGALLLGAMVRTGGRAVVSGSGRALLAGVCGGLAGYAAGAGVVGVVGPVGVWASAGVCVLTALAVTVAFVLVAFTVDATDVRAALRGMSPGRSR